MTTIGRSQQIVFLIDERLARDEGLDDFPLENITSAIRLSALKILTYFAHKSADGFENLKWGRKFFNSQQYQPYMKVERYYFYEFSQDSFEEFENDLESRLESERLTTHGLVKELVHPPVVSLQNAFKELLHDFQWDRPDIKSPVKPTRGARNKQKKNQPSPRSASNNLVFVFSPVWLRGELDKFTGHNNTRSLLDLIMGPAVYRQFYETNKISLHWLDVPSATCWDGCDIKVGYEELNAVLNQLDGAVIPLGALLNLGHRETTHILSCLGDNKNPESQIDSINQSGSVVPFSAVLSSCVSFVKYGELEQGVPRHGLLCLTRSGDQQTVCAVEVHPMVQAGTNIREWHGQTERSSHHKNKRSASSVPVQISVSQSGSASSKASSTRDHTDFKVEYSSSPPSSAEGYTGEKMSLIVKATLQQNSVPLEHFSTSHTYSVLDGGPGTGGSLEREGAVNLSALLLQMAKHRLVLVVDCVVPSTGVIAVGVMQPLTSVSATLTFIKTDMILALEKIVSFRSTVRNQLPKNEALKEFVGRATKHLACAMQKVDKTGLPGRCPDPASIENTVPYRSSQLEKWYVAGYGKTEPLLNSLEDSVSDFEEEVNILHQLQKAYRKQKEIRPITALSPIKTRSTPQKTKEAVKLRQSPRFKRTKSNQTLSRSALIMAKSKEVIAQTKKGSPRKSKRQSHLGGKTDARPVEAGTEFSNETELVQYLQESYDAALNDKMSAASCAQSIASIVLFYYKNHSADNPEKSAVELIAGHLKETSSQLKEKYATVTEDQQNKIKEHKLQILLQLETETLVATSTEELEDEELEERVQEVVKMLRALSFATDPTYISAYLQEEIVDSYIHTLPKTLCKIYDELMQPLPEQLESLFSPSEADRSMGSVAPPSVASANSDTLLFSEDSMGPFSNSQGPWSNRARTKKLVHHPSLSDIGFKRQIQVAMPKFRKPKSDAPKEQKKKTTSSAKKRKAEKQEAQCEVTRVRRNLFMNEGVKLERRQSVAIMENVARRRSPRKRAVSRELVLKTKSVAETPKHKQVSKVLWHKQEKVRQRTNTESDVQVVEESPEKPVKQAKSSVVTKLATRKSPRRISLPGRRSFYSGAVEKKSRNVTKYYNRQLADRIAGRPRSQSEAPGGELFSKLLTSPSPGRAGCKMRTAGWTPRSSAARKLLNLSSPGKEAVNVPDTPGRNTRSQTPRKSIAETPQKSPSVPDTPSRNTRSLERRSPEKMNFRTPSKPPPVRGILTSPEGSTSRRSLLGLLQGGSTPKKTPSKVVFSEPLVVKSCPLLHGTPKKSEISSHSRSPVAASLGRRSNSPRKSLVSELSGQGSRTPRKDRPSQHPDNSSHLTRTPRKQLEALAAEEISSNFVTPQKSNRGTRSPRKSVSALDTTSSLKMRTGFAGALAAMGTATVFESPKRRKTKVSKEPPQPSGSGPRSEPGPSESRIGVTKPALFDLSREGGRETKGKAVDVDFDDDWGQSPERIKVDLSNILPLLGASPVPSGGDDKKHEDKTGEGIKDNTSSFTPPSQKQGVNLESSVLTPSRKPSLKTPDSLNKWHRRKVRHVSNTSPGSVKSLTTTPDKLSLLSSVHSSPASVTSQASAKTKPKAAKTKAKKNVKKKKAATKSTKCTSDVNVDSPPKGETLYGSDRLLERSEVVRSSVGSESDEEVAFTKLLGQGIDPQEILEREPVFVSPNAKRKARIADHQREALFDVSGVRDGQDSKTFSSASTSSVCASQITVYDQPPVRYTRKLSKETGITPELFQFVATISPDKERISEHLQTPAPAKAATPKRRCDSLEPETADTGGTPSKRRRLTMSISKNKKGVLHVKSRGSSLSRKLLDHGVKFSDATSSKAGSGVLNSSQEYFSSGNDDVFLSAGDSQDENSMSCSEGTREAEGGMSDGGSSVQRRSTRRRGRGGGLPRHSSLLTDGTSNPGTLPESASLPRHLQHHHRDTELSSEGSVESLTFPRVRSLRGKASGGVSESSGDSFSSRPHSPLVRFSSMNEESSDSYLGGTASQVFAGAQKDQSDVVDISDNEDSPIKGKKVGLPNYSGDMQPPPSGAVLDRSKLSPNISAKSLMHLMSSPMLQEGSGKFRPSSSTGSRPQRRSRRSLY